MQLVLRDLILSLLQMESDVCLITRFRTMILNVHRMQELLLTVSATAKIQEITVILNHLLLHGEFGKLTRKAETRHSLKRCILS